MSSEASPQTDEACQWRQAKDQMIIASGGQGAPMT